MIALTPPTHRSALHDSKTGNDFADNSYTLIVRYTVPDETGVNGWTDIYIYIYIYIYINTYIYTIHTSRNPSYGRFAIS